MNQPVSRHSLPRTRALAVTGGKGGVGKSTVAVNLAVALAQHGERVVLLDADLSLANLDVLLGLESGMTLADVMAGRCTLQQAVRQGPAGLRVVPATSGDPRMARLNDLARAGLIHAFSELGPDLDWLVIDTAAGITPTTLQFCMAAQDVLLVICDEPTSIADASAMVRVMYRQGGRQRFRVLVNRARSVEAAQATFLRLLNRVEELLGVTLEYAGNIPLDGSVSRAARAGKPVVTAHPDAASSDAFVKLARATGYWPSPATASGGCEFFFENRIHNEVMERRART